MNRVSLTIARRRALARRRMRGNLAAEALLVIPILVLFSVSMLELGLIVSLKQSVAHAAIQGVRLAAQGGSVAEVSVVVDKALSGFESELSSNAGFTIEDPSNLSMPVRAGGVVACTPPSDPSFAELGNNVRLTVCAQSTGSPVLSVMAHFGGPDLVNKLLTRSAVAKRECP